MSEMTPKGKRSRIGKVFRSFGYAFQGIRYAYLHEQNMAIHLCIALITILLGLLFGISQTEWFFVLVIIGLVLSMELLNTSIESLVDLVSPNEHPFAKIAKDTAAGAVSILAITAFIGGSIIFIPHVLALFNI